MIGTEHRLYDLLPGIYRQRDEALGFPLRDLLGVIAEQVDVVEADVAQLYENWFIETCQEWVVPYLGDLIGYRPVDAAGEAGEVGTVQGQQRNRVLIPRREVANTLRYRRRKGTAALLELLARDVAGWPARAVELYRLVGFTQHLAHQRPHRGRTADLRRGHVLDHLGGPFDRLSHTADVRRVASRRTAGRPNLPGVALYVWRLRSYPVSGTVAYCKERGDHHYTFSVLGNDAPCFVKPEAETDPTHIAEEVNVPSAISRRALAAHKERYYGPGKSMQVLRVIGGKKQAPPRLEPIGPDEIVVADLSGWHYQARKGQVLVDPQLGRVAFPPRHVPKHGIRVFYHYGFSADLGGGEYPRPILQPAGEVVERDGNAGATVAAEEDLEPRRERVFLYRVGEGEATKSIHGALGRWRHDRPRHAVVEITDSGDYVESVEIVLEKDQTLQLRGASGKRPVIRLLDRQTSSRDSLSVEGAAGSSFTLDGLLVTGRGVRIEGNLAAVTVRHSTLVPGWGLHGDCAPREPGEPSLELVNLHAAVSIEHSIVGAVVVNQDEVATDPLPLAISDCIVDATSRERLALSGPDGLMAHARLTVQRSTVFGAIHVHALALGENSIFDGVLDVARRQTGCLRFCYVAAGRTPRRFACQPDRAEQAAAAEPVETDAKAAAARARERVRPWFRSTRYSSPDYARLADATAEEIRRGADDEAEMGVFHDLFEPQRAANLRARLDEYTPAGVDAGLVFADQEAP